VSSSGRPHRRPPWWPDGEPWPPPNGQGSWGHWRHRRDHRWAGRRRPFGCVLVVVVLLAASTLTAGVWALAALVGLVSAPPIVLVGGLVATVLVGVATTVGLTSLRRMSEPLDDLSEAAERIERGDYTTRVAERGPWRVRSLARAFNQMGARLADVDSGRRTFLADAAHELRTPLSVIEGQLEAIEDGVYPADAEHLAPIREQIRTLEKLIDDMRTVALAESGSLVLNLQPTDLADLIDDSMAAFGAQAGAGSVELTTDVSPGLSPALADEQRIRQVMANLLANALRHTPAEGRIRIAARSSTGRDELVVEVADTGTGIPPELLPHVLERFVREPGSAGSGLGLAICRDIVDAHGGQISIASEPGRGTTVTFSLPLAS
jgi:two-component system OmpR family sensor kinase/two-component system sensor histidine kinase BaeS